MICLDHQQNPYKPTYTFPDEFNGDSDHMEDYIRKTASKTIEKDNRKKEIEDQYSTIIIILIGMTSTSSVRPLTSNLK
jgi:hypothetical protein